LQRLNAPQGSPGRPASQSVGAVMGFVYTNKLVLLAELLHGALSRPRYWWPLTPVLSPLVPIRIDIKCIMRLLP
jgi:hypothetical protein